MLPLALDFLAIDPMPISPAVSRDSMAYWRWYSRVLLQARAEAA